MEIEDTLNALRRLQGFFGKKLSPEAVEFYLQEFRFLPDNVFNAAISECQRTERTFPTVTVLRNYVIDARRQMERSGISGARIKTLADIYRETPNDPQYIVESKKILSRIALPCGHPMHLCGELLVSEMLTMENAFPGRGWGKHASGLKADLNKDAMARAVQKNKRETMQQPDYRREREPGEDL